MAKRRDWFWHEVAPLLAAVCVALLAALAITRVETRTILAGTAATGVVFAVVRWPALTVLAVLVVCQELNPALGLKAYSPLLALGHQVYFTEVGGFSVIALITYGAAALTFVAFRLTSGRRVVLWVLLVLGALCAARGYYVGAGPLNAVNQNARFAVLFAAAFVVGAYAVAHTPTREQFLPVMAAIFAGMTLFGSYLLVSGQGLSLGSGGRFVFYDSALAAVAGAAVLAVLFTPRAQQNRVLYLLGLAALAIVVLSARRNVWAAMTIAALLALLVIRHRAQTAGKIVLGVAIVTGFLLIAAPGLGSTVVEQAGSIVSALRGNPEREASTAVHLDDIGVGWNAIQDHMWAGVGPNQLVPGTDAQGKALYIHNEVLQAWLRYGLVAMLLLVAVQLLLIVQGLRALRDPEIDFMRRWAACLVMIWPVAAMSAPFLATTQRWPIAVGFGAGILASR